MAAAKAVEPAPRITRSYLSCFISPDDSTGSNASRVVAHHGSSDRQQVAHTRVSNAIVDLFARARGLHQPTPAQAPQVCRDAALGSTNCRDQFAHCAPRIRCIKEQAQQAHACRITYHMEEACIEFCLNSR